jgi:hypothetical protein
MISCFPKKGKDIPMLASVSAIDSIGGANGKQASIRVRAQTWIRCRPRIKVTR